MKCNENQIEIAVSDQGQGIPEHERERIFDMFYTMERGDRGQSGTGLGLTIVKAIIGAHMGNISASPAKITKARVFVYNCLYSPIDFSHGLMI